MRRELSLADIFQLGYYWESKILLTAVTLDVFSVLGDGSLPATEIATRLEVDPRALTLLLNALVAMRLIEKEGGRFFNTGVGRRHLVRTSPEYIGHLLVLHDAEWDNWRKLEEAVRTGRSPVRGHVFANNPALGAHVLAVLHRIGRQNGPQFAKRLALEKARTLLDLGGGAGTNAIACCQTYPALRATVFDLPETLAVTEPIVKEAGMASRIDLLAGDFNKDSLGGPYDVILMSDILHYQPPETNAALVQKAHDHLVNEGRLVIKDRFLSESGTSPAWTTAFAVHILLNTEEGRCYTVHEAQTWMERAGLRNLQTLEATSVLQGVKRNGNARGADG